MALSNVNIKLGNGALGRSSASSDGVTGLVLTGKEVAGKLNQNQVYLLSSVRDLTTLGITEEENPLVYKEVTGFYTHAGDGAQLYLLVVPESTTLTAMAAITDGSPIRKLIDAGGGRIRLVGLNKIAPEEYELKTENGIDEDSITAAAALHAVAENYFATMRSFRAMVPACSWTGKTDKLYKPRESSYNRVGFVLASDAIIQEQVSPAIGQVLGRAASMSVSQSIARVKSGAIDTKGYLSDGSDPDTASGKWELLEEAGYIFYRTFPSKNGVYFNGDPMAAPLSDDYSSLRYGRTIDKAARIAYEVYIEEIQENVEVEEDGTIPEGACRMYESMLERGILNQMSEDISSNECYIDSQQNILSTETMNVTAQIVPRGLIKAINVNLGFKNPALNT